MPTRPDRIALCVQQPWADLIVRGVKTIELRSKPARIRGAIYIYASRTNSSLPDAAVAESRFGLDVAALPKGLIVGTADLMDSRLAVPADATAACTSRATLVGRFAWMMENAVRFDGPLPVPHLPYGIWFYPFKRKA